MKAITNTFIIIFTSIFIVIFHNSTFFEHVLQVYPLSSDNIGFFFSTAFIIYALLAILFALFSSKYTLKPILISTLVLSYFIHYFMQAYNIVVDKTMIENILQTDIKEGMDLMSVDLFIDFFFIAFLPALIVYKIPLKQRRFKTEFWSKIKFISIHLLLILLTLFTFSKFYTSFFREHKILRLYVNPITAIYSLTSYTYSQLKDVNIPMQKIGLDAKQIKTKNEKRKIIIMVVGEAARGDHFSLNGYNRETNPLLKKEDIINFQNMYSCGTTTAVSVPCMFSVYDRDEYSSNKGYNTHSVLDVLSHAGVEVLWRDNNSNSKGVAVRLTYENYKTSTLNTMCEGECRDMGMLVGLKQKIEQSTKDIIIVLHQMGNHGPAYYKRYPKSFEKFTPVCETSQLEKCSVEEIKNAYDNAILYTDYFLVQTIDFLKKYEESADTAMIYMSDHGESLGDNGLYLHGLPYFMAPKHQKHVGAIMWFGKDFPLDTGKIKSKANNQYSHDNLFSTLLGVFNVQAKVYEKEMDILTQ